MELGNIINGESVATVAGEMNIDVERPKRVLYFSDGTMEEFSESESDEEKKDAENEVNKMEIVESQQAWAPWFYYKAWQLGTTIVAGCDYLGEKLASFLGITSPKYENEIAECKRIQAENERNEKEKAEHASWMEKKSLNDYPITTEGGTKQNQKF